MPEMAAEAPATEPGKEPMPAMSFLDHLEELRRRIIYSIIAVAGGFFCCWRYAEPIYVVMARPIIEGLRPHRMAGRVVSLNPTEPLYLYLKIGLLAGLLVA